MIRFLLSLVFMSTYSGPQNAPDSRHGPTAYCLLPTAYWTVPPRNGPLEGPPKKPPKKPPVDQFVQKYIECAGANDSSCLRDMMEQMSADSQAACTTLASRIEGETEEAQPNLAAAMADLKCPQIVATASKLLANVESDVRGPLCVQFARTKDKALVELVSQLVKAGRPFDKEKGCEALAILGYKEAIPTLVEATSDSFFSVRLQAAAALGDFKSDEAREALCRLVTEDQNSGVRVKAAESLGKLKDLASVPCLTKALESKTGLVLTAVHVALIAVTGLDVGMDPVAWQQWWEKNKPQKRR